MLNPNMAFPKKVIIFLLGLFTIALTFYACDVSSSNERLDDQLTLENVKMAHRVAMENAFHEFEPKEDIKNLNDKINYLSEFNSNSLKELKVNGEVYTHLSFAIENNKRMVYQFEYESPFTKQKIVSNDPFVVQDLAIQDLKTTDLFSDEEIHLLERVGNLFNASLYSSYMADSISLYKEEYSKLSYMTSESYFQVGIVLAIAEESHQWWNENPEAAWGNPKLHYPKGSNSQTVLPGPLATDVAGAIIGGAVTLGGQFVFAEEVNWAIVGYGAVAGAVVGSTGAVGRLAGWLSKL